MNFGPLQIKDAFGLTAPEVSDERGSLVRIWDSVALPQNFGLVQSSIVTNPSIGTLRGLHFQVEPYSESKLIICVSGKVFDVLLDLRVGSETFCEHIEIEIGPNCTFQGILIPPGFAHGYLTLEANSNLIYFMDKAYSKSHAIGVNWNDPDLMINWPIFPKLVSQRDTLLPYLNDFLNSARDYES